MVTACALLYMIHIINVLTIAGQFGMPRFNVALFIGFLAAYCASAIESIGDYYTLSRVCHVYPPPHHAINRGILIEGVMGLVSGALGTGHATTSYTNNIAAIKITNVR